MKKRHHYQTVTLLFIATLLSIYNCAEIEVDIEDETSNRVLLREPETHEPIININNVVVHNDTIYIGAENVLLKVDARTLRIVQSVRTGPLLDSPMCRYAPREECLYSRRKSLTPNYNKIVLVLPDTQSLLTCWTAFQGVCETRDLDDLSRLKSNSTVAVVANDPVNSTIAFQATSPNSQRLLYVATTYTSLGAYRDDLPALSGRSLQPHRFMQVIESNNQLKTVKSSIEFVSRFRKSFIVKYITGFNLGLHNYYLSVQHTDTDALLANQPLVTKISRLCLNDLSFTKSYTEITLKCLSGSRGSISSLRSVDYNELIASKLVEIDGEHFLIGLFQQTTRTNFNMSLHTSASSTNNNNAPIRQAICVYPMKAVTAKIHENINRYLIVY
jgi:plexin A